VVFCFADPGHADLFRERFGGERIEPNGRKLSNGLQS